MTVEKEAGLYTAVLEIKNVAVEDAGKYKVTAKNELGESNATISLNFDSKWISFKINRIRKLLGSWSWSYYFFWQNSEKLLNSLSSVGLRALVWELNASIRNYIW